MAAVAGALEDVAAGARRIDFVVGQDLGVGVVHAAGVIDHRADARQREIEFDRIAGPDFDADGLGIEPLKLIDRPADRHVVAAGNHLHGPVFAVHDEHGVGEVLVGVVGVDDRKQSFDGALNLAGQLPEAVVFGGRGRTGTGGFSRTANHQQQAQARNRRASHLSPPPVWRAVQLTKARICCRHPGKEGVPPSGKARRLPSQGSVGALWPRRESAPPSGKARRREGHALAPRDQVCQR